MEEAIFEYIGVYIQNRQNMVALSIATRLILDLCERSVWWPGSWVSWRWWEQGRLDLAGARERAVAVTYREEEKRKEEALQEKTTGRS